MMEFVLGFALGFWICVFFCRKYIKIADDCLKRSHELNKETKQLQESVTLAQQRALLRLVDDDGVPLVEISNN